MKCKNCGHEEKHHISTQYYKGKDCHVFVNEDALDFERCDCKQFIPQENNNLYPKGHEKVTRGCGKAINYPDGTFRMNCGFELYPNDFRLCPSCSPNSPVITGNSVDSETAGKDPETLRYTNQSGSDIPLSDKPECKYMLSGVCEHCLAEAVRKLKEEIDIIWPIGVNRTDKLKERIDKIFGDFE